jgi:hypothetical protein
MFRIGKVFCKEGGQNFVELAITLPIMLLIFFGMVELGFAAHTYLVAVNAAREGARFGSRGVHVPVDEIAHVVETALVGNLDLDFDGLDANVAIIVSQIDIDEDGNYVIYDRGVRGDLFAQSAICEPSDLPCGSDELDLQEFINTNLRFNSTPGLCQETEGCSSDFVIVEVFHRYEAAILAGFTREIIPNPFQVNTRAIMRVLHRRAPSF